jgi:hypothetical protein
MQGHEATAAEVAAGVKASRYSPEERRERIERYRSKRNLRNFQKKITVSASLLLPYNSYMYVY